VGTLTSAAHDEDHIMAVVVTPSAPPSPADLQATRDAVVEVVECSVRAINAFHGPGPDPAVARPEGREQIPAIVG
jgi:hypothetical protein